MLLSLHFKKIEKRCCITGHSYYLVVIVFLRIACDRGVKPTWSEVWEYRVNNGISANGLERGVGVRRRQPFTSFKTMKNILSPAAALVGAGLVAVAPAVMAMTVGLGAATLATPTEAKAQQWGSGYVTPWNATPVGGTNMFGQTRYVY